MQTWQVSRNFRESPEMARDLQVSRNCKKIFRNWGNLIDLLFFRKSLLLSYFPKCLSLPMNITQCGVNIWFRFWRSRPWKMRATTPPPTTEFCRLPETGEHGKTSGTIPPPPNLVGFWRWRKNSATTPPTELRRLLEITEKTQEIQQAQLGSSASWES